jgi:hypothetical protein
MNTYWTPARIRILSHPRLLRGGIYNAEKDRHDVYFVDTEEGGETVWQWECEELPAEIERDWED